jgi:hypothetical protein
MVSISGSANTTQTQAFTRELRAFAEH